MSTRALRVATLSYLIPPKSLSEVERGRLADLLSGYAADLWKGAMEGGLQVSFEIIVEGVE